MTKMGNMSVLTVEGRVTIPLDVREALGLKPNEPVEFSRNTNGEVVIRRPVVQPDEDGPDLEAALHRLDAALERWKHLRTGRDPDDYMAELREPLPTPNPADL